MNDKQQQLYFLIKRAEETSQLPQSVKNEFEIAALKMEIVILESEINLDVAARTLLFLNAWKKCGTFTAIRTTGERRDAQPYVTGNAIQDFWNVRSEADNLARWSYKID